MLDTPLVADPVTEPQAGTPRPRLEIIDKLRGLVIVLMVLDHVRDFFTREPFSPTDLAHTTVALFATRWITHLCAPTFVTLAGVAVFLQWERGKRGLPLVRFLVTRGLWLIALELTWVSFGFGFDEPFFLLQVIWAIGMSFILLAPCTLMPPAVVLALGFAIVGAHDLLAHVPAPSTPPLDLLWTLFVEPGRIPHGYVPYPALPWFGLMACGFGAGRLFLLAPERRDRLLVGLGLAMLAGFALLRGPDGYGDPAPWATQQDATHTILSFLKVTKYPPSLDYTLATLGIVFTIAPAVARLGGAFGRMILTFGRVPLFVYLIHLYVAHGAAVLTRLAMGVAPRLTFGGRPEDALAAAKSGVGLPAVYLAWICVVLALWPLAAWYERLKSRRRDWWLAYL
ncbi:hypothetical protein RHCH11_RHCH11_00746 [Beijerinckiaceae bacterium RH CH11]|nr:heparan-alpha-glucosaminide N-acetyltransferase domain-containing protein [Beijerinckiaceae bacterium]VVB43525.1 hypothetical protein RHAL8_00744 [Beijerinckiaceae bacterium RH AL8]VVB43542.1 hypothetical protein RHCH11_RHCH11_00746 [Beijerinckiaceae bacterium RH CH11]